VWHDLLRDSTFLDQLCAIDGELADQAQARGCPCGGRLHRANYARKPRGGPPDPPSGFALRHSFCCDQDGCRRRHTPPSVRFLGRRVYLGAIVVLLSAMTQGVSPSRARRLRDALGVDRRTLVRWRDHWAGTFPRSAFWRSARARFMPALAAEALPGALLDRFAPSPGTEGLISLLRFLASA